MNHKKNIFGFKTSLDVFIFQETYRIGHTGLTVMPAESNGSCLPALSIDLLLVQNELGDART
jgi:hypothetical protein